VGRALGSLIGRWWLRCLVLAPMDGLRFKTALQIETGAAPLAGLLGANTDGERAIPVAYGPHGAVPRSAGNRIDSRGFGPAINYRPNYIGPQYPP
jgi:hypothetical protein